MKTNILTPKKQHTARIIAKAPASNNYEGEEPSPGICRWCFSIVPRRKYYYLKHVLPFCVCDNELCKQYDNTQNASFLSVPPKLFLEPSLTKLKQLCVKKRILSCETWQKKKFDCISVEYHVQAHTIASVLELIEFSGWSQPAKLSCPNITMISNTRSSSVSGKLKKQQGTSHRQAMIDLRRFIYVLIDMFDGGSDDAVTSAVFTWRGWGQVLTSAMLCASEVFEGELLSFRNTKESVMYAEDCDEEVEE
eukprot:PhF_6_TR7033/c0_g1_i1/m.10545